VRPRCSDYTAVEETVTKSGTPYFSFKDIDENKPTGSIKIRVETISYFLKRYREDMVRNKTKQADVDTKLREFEAKLRAEFEGLVPSPPPAPYEMETPVGLMQFGGNSNHSERRIWNRSADLFCRSAALAFRRARTGPTEQVRATSWPWFIPQQQTKATRPRPVSSGERLKIRSQRFTYPAEKMLGTHHDPPKVALPNRACYDYQRIKAEGRWS